MPILDLCHHAVDRLRGGEAEGKKRKRRKGKKKEQKRKGGKRYLPSGSVASKVGKGARKPAVDFIKC